jgi:hypothetical protein
LITRTEQVQDKKNINWAAKKVECKDTQTSVWSSQYNINVAIKLSEAYTNKIRVIARLKQEFRSEWK